MADTSGSLNGDPAAEFLAREQETLAGLDDDLVLTAGHTNGISDGFGESMHVDVCFATGIIMSFTSRILLSTSGETNGHSEDEGIVHGSSDVYSSSSVNYTEVKPEPEKIRVWREAQERMLKEKDDEESVKRDELKQQAIRELAEWKTRYAEQLEKSKKSNKNAEKEWLAERDQPEDPGQEWEKISKLCDFNPKPARKDTSRLRSILLQLKQSPPSPPPGN